MSFSSGRHGEFSFSAMENKESIPGSDTTLTHTCHSGHVRFHQDLLFPRPEELKCSSNPFSGPSNTHRTLSMISLPSIGKIGPRCIASLESIDSGRTKPRNPMNNCQGFPCSCRDFTRREIGTYDVVNRVPLVSPIPDPRCHLSSILPPRTHASG